MGNIAGRLGFLDFRLPGGKVVITRTGLKLDPTKNQGDLVIDLRSSPGTQVTLVAAGSESTATTQDATQMIRFPLNWKDTVRRVELRFDGPPGSVVEIDSIAVMP